MKGSASTANLNAHGMRITFQARKADLQPRVLSTSALGRGGFF